MHRQFVMFFLKQATEEEECDEEAGGGAVDLILGVCGGCDSGVVRGFVIQGMHCQIRGCPILQDGRGEGGRVTKRLTTDQMLGKVAFHIFISLLLLIY